MNYRSSVHDLCWESATGLAPSGGGQEDIPQGMLVTETDAKTDRIAVVYHQGDTPPEITIQEVSSSVHTVMANGIAVAVVARAAGPAVSAEEVLLVERMI